MARTYNKNKSGSAKEAPAKAVQAAAPAKTVSAASPAASEKAPAPSVKKAAPVKKAASAKAVIASPDKKVMQQIVYEPCAQILTREVDASETFAIGDDMPIYYL